MCNFCDNIKNIEWYKERAFWERDNAIVQMGENTFGLWIECDDSFFSRVAMKINFCPLCGANLALKKERNVQYGFNL